GLTLPSESAPAGSPNGSPKGTPLITAGATATTVDAKPEAKTVVWGKTFAISGRLLAADRTPMAGVSLDVFQTVALKGAGPSKVATIVTDAQGRYTFAATATASSAYRIAYAEHLGAADYTAARTVNLAVPAGASLQKQTHGAPRRGMKVAFAGQVGAAVIPTGGAEVAIQYHSASGWQTTAIVSTNRDGAFAWKHTFRTAGPYRLRARVRLSPGLANAPGMSPELRFRIR
ncbi:MAG: hypothetical protein REI11_10440, partial [Patulibacter sp.]|nr:hypothetical protein [Patulibacter sp.]